MTRKEVWGQGSHIDLFPNSKLNSTWHFGIMARKSFVSENTSKFNRRIFTIVSNERVEHTDEML